MDRSDGIESPSKTLRKAGQHVQVKGRPHQETNHHQVQGQDSGLAKPMSNEALRPSQQSAGDQSDAHRDLNYEIQVWAITGMGTKESFHGAHFLTCAKPKGPN